MTNDNLSLGAGIMLSVILLIILFTVLAQLLPELENAGDQLNQTNICGGLTGCIFNATNSSAAPCRDSINQSLNCQLGDGEVPLNSLFSFSIIGLLVAAVVILLVISALASKLRNK